MSSSEEERDGEAIALYGSEFVPQEATIMSSKNGRGARLVVRNEDTEKHAIYCKGCADVTSIAPSSSRSISFNTVGRFELRSSDNARTKVTSHS
jgi:hypothetical protein